MFKAWDQVISGCLQGGTNKVATLSCIPAIFLNLLNALLLFSGLIALVMFIMGGYKFISASGDPKKVAAAENNFKFSIIGMAVVLSSFLIINIISIVTHTQCIKTFGFGCN